MTNKDAINYARELFKRGFTSDAARSILLSKGWSQKEVDNALKVASSPERHISLTTLLGIAIALIVILIPTLFFLTKDSSVASNSPQQELQDKNVYQPENKAAEFKCSIDNECLFDEICQDGSCIKLSCSDCEDLFNHACIPLECSDENACTSDYCSQGTCLNDQITSCTSYDNCCPSGCNETLDTDCKPLANTTNGCATDLDCSDGDLLTINKCEALGTNGTKICIHLTPQCGVNEGICPTNCTTLSDNDCSATCGNSIKEAEEECDGNCPTSQSQCNDNQTCTVDTLLGSASLCTAECIHTNIAVCVSNDGCCPSSCVYSLDNDCPANSTLLASGSFTSVQRTAQGSVELYSYEDGTHKVLFSPSFSLANSELNPSLKVYLASKPIVTTFEDLNAGNIEIGQLKSIGGAQEYKITSFIGNIKSYKSIVIYHQSYNSIFTYATLNYG